MTKVYVNDIQREIQVPTGYDNLFNNVRFNSETQLANAIAYAKKANDLFYGGILTKNTDDTLSAVCWQNKLIQILEDCRDEAILEEYADCYDLRNDISTYETEAA